MPNLLYSVVARHNVVLARYADSLGNFSEVTDLLLSRIDTSKDASLTFSSGNYLYHYILRDGIVFLCFADQDFRRTTAFAFLDTIKSKFDTQFGGQASSALPFAMNVDFAPTMASELRRYNSLEADQSLNRIDLAPPQPDVPERTQQLAGSSNKIHQLRDQVERVQEIMASNIDAIVDRGEMLELLVDKTEKLSNRSVTFRQRSRHLARKMWWQNVKVTLAVVVAILVFVYIVVSVSCGGLAWQDCIRRNGTL